ncbi:ferrous iron transporter B [Candidatus Roizmanbacteria bacterium]|nr:ferrous iron transporter B [Candidatus Roizmanbacteria bacterium]
MKILPADCCKTEIAFSPSKIKQIVLVGPPNVGKSALFNSLTDSYVTVSNYPGTTVGISKTTTHILGNKFEVIDTPGMYSLTSLSKEEKISASILFTTSPYVVIHVIDAKNIKRLLPFTLQLIDVGLPVILVLNMSDELKKYGLLIDITKLQKLLHIPVIATTATTGKGVDEVKSAIAAPRGASSQKYSVTYDPRIENDPHLLYKVALTRQQNVIEMVKKVISHTKPQRKTWSDKLSNLMVHPLTGIPFLLLVMYVGLYLIVGKFGAGIAVDFIENNIFKAYLNPFFYKTVTQIVPWTLLQDLLVGEFGILTLGLRYAIAIILPIVSTFFFVFAIIEDSGYLPRLAMLIDRLFKKIGLSGRSVIPMVLGLGCTTMATMVTRTLPTKRERVMATILLALAVPCSAQLGVLFTLLVAYPNALLLWCFVITGIFLLVGYLGARLLPGNAPLFFMEIPPLRLPTLSNILIKTYARMAWYIQEVFPLFILASFLLWLGQLLGIFKILVDGLRYPMILMGLPPRTAVAYIFGFFRRDYGAAGLYDMQKAGIFSVNQLAIAVITMTLLPACVASGLMMVKERGKWMGIAIFVFCVAVSFTVGILLNMIFTQFNIRL